MPKHGDVIRGDFHETLYPNIPFDWDADEAKPVTEQVITEFFFIPDADASTADEAARRRDFEAAGRARRLREQAQRTQRTTPYFTIPSRED